MIAWYFSDSIYYFLIKWIALRGKNVRSKRKARKERCDFYVVFSEVLRTWCLSGAVWILDSREAEAEVQIGTKNWKHITICELIFLSLVINIELSREGLQNTFACAELIILSWTNCFKVHIIGSTFSHLSERIIPNLFLFW